ncbi:MAG: hypothetical protein Fur0037_26180 [Planctomycetota bacterium]
MRTLAPPLILILAAALPAQATWWVSPTGNDANPGTQGSPFLTINHANAIAASGDVIRLTAGTFGDEQGNVVLGDKDVALVGDGRDSTILVSHSTQDITLPSGFPTSPTNEAHRPALALRGTARVDIRSLTLDCAFHLPSTARAYCLWAAGGVDATASDVEFRNARSNPLNGSQRPLGVYVRGDNPSDITRVTLRNCLVHEFGKGGIVAVFDADLVVEDSVIDGTPHVGLGLPAQNGIQISYGATGAVRRTTLTDLWYDPSAWVASGILFYDAGSLLEIEDCSLGNCQASFYIYASTPTTYTGSVRRNTVQSAQYGIYFSGASGFSVEDNSFSIGLSGSVDDA